MIFVTAGFKFTGKSACTMLVRQLGSFIRNCQNLGGNKDALP